MVPKVDNSLHTVEWPGARVGDDWYVRVCNGVDVCGNGVEAFHVDPHMVGDSGDGVSIVELWFWAWFLPN